MKTQARFVSNFLFVLFCLVVEEWKNFFWVFLGSLFSKTVIWFYVIRCSIDTPLYRVMSCSDVLRRYILFCNLKFENFWLPCFFQGHLLVVYVFHWSHLNRFLKVLIRFCGHFNKRARHVQYLWFFYTGNVLTCYLWFGGFFKLAFSRISLSQKQLVG